MADAKTPATYEAPKELPQQNQTQKFQGRPKRTPEDQAEYFYNLKTMHLVFFISSLAMLITLVWSMHQDWDRSWKEYQGTYQALELARVENDLQRFTREKVRKDGERRRLETEKQRLEKELETKTVAVTLDDKVENLTEKQLEERKTAIAGDHASKMQRMNFVKSDYMTFRYRFDEAGQHVRHAEEAHNPRIAVYEQILAKEKRVFEAVVAEVAKSKAEFDAVDAQMTAIENALIALRKPLTVVEEDRKKLDADMEAALRRIRREMPQLANAIRNAPGLDFFEPTLKVQQVILPDVQMEMHFAKIERVDRCHTCHMGIGNPTYATATEKNDKGHETAVFKDEYLRSFTEHATGAVDPKACAVCRQEAEGLVTPEGTTMPSHILVKHGEWTKDKADAYTRALAAHPRLDLYVGGASPHPIAKFGCTSCHEGDGRDTEFSNVVHFPNDEEQHRQWETRYGYHYRELWDEPMLPKKHVYSSCRKCHSQQTEIADAGPYNDGMKLYERLGCYACHRTDSYQILPKDHKDMDAKGEINRKYRRPGPPLTHVKDKVTPDWMYKWVLAPKDYRHTTRMPHFFGQSNARKVKSLDKTKEYRAPEVDSAIVAAVTNWVMDASQTRRYGDLPKTGHAPDAKRGELVFEQVGCRACHTTQADDAYPAPRELRNADDKYRAPDGASHYMSEFGPNLSGMGSKTNKGWLYAWLRDPKHYFSQTRMGSFRLTEQEAVDVVEFLMSLRKPAFEQAPGLPAALDEGLIDALVFEQLKAKMPDVDAIAEMKPWGKDYKVWWLGRRMVQNYSCYSCHELTDETQDKKIKEYTRKDGDKPRTVAANNWLDMDGIGVELTGAQPWGQKGVDKLAFNFAEYEPPNYNGVSFTHPITGKPYHQVGTKENDGVVRVHKTRQDFFHAKMLNPRVFDGGRSESTPPDELLRMPNFYLTPTEATSLATFVLSFKDAESTGLVERAKKRLSPDEVALARGQRLVRESNCRGCHRLELDKFKVEWSREENGKRVTTPVWVEGRLKREAPPAEVKAALEKLGLKAGEGARLLTLDWTMDGSSMEKHALVAGVLPQIAFDGVSWWLLKGEERHPVLVHRPQDGGDILDHIRSFKRKVGSEYWIDVSDPGAFESRFPPHLRSQGVKTQSEWFYAFLKDPYPIRPNLNPLLPDLSGIPAPSADLRAKVKAEVAKLADPDGDDDELLEPLKKLGRDALPAIRDEWLGAKDAVTRWRLMLLMRVSAHPDLSVRMPTFGFADEEASSIAKYFWVRDQKKGVDIYPHTAFPERDRPYLAARQGAIEDAVKNVIKDCVACHVYDGKVPPLDDAKGSNKIAPDFNQMETRLRGRWLYEWLREPGSVYPSTTMTAYTYEPDDRRRATVEFILNFQKYKALRN